MCVILYALKKKHMRRAEIVEAMRSNSAGFAMFALKPDGDRDSIRTLDEKQLLDFFDKKVGDDDAVAMHARIPSRGDKNLSNVHGWEEDGVVFMHNMTLYTLDDLMREDGWKGTDSEYFFRSVFMPLYRRWGTDAYKDGKLDPFLDKMVKLFAGTSNKFLFIMPDNRVLRYGSWVSEPARKEGDQIAFFASNSTYRVPERTWQRYSAPLTAGRNLAGTEYFGGDEEDYTETEACRGTYVRTFSSTPPEYDGSVLRRLAGDAKVAAAGLKLHVLSNALANRSIAAGDVAGGLDMIKHVESLHEVLLTSIYNNEKDLVDAADIYVERPDGPPGSQEYLAAWMSKWSTKLEGFLERDSGTAKVKYFRANAAKLRRNFDAFCAKLDAALAISDVTVDTGSANVDNAITAFMPDISRKGRPTMRKSILSDLITPMDMTDENARSAVQAILDYIATAKDSKKGEETT